MKTVLNVLVMLLFAHEYTTTISRWDVSVSSLRSSFGGGADILAAMKQTARLDDEEILSKTKAVLRPYMANPALRCWFQTSAHVCVHVCTNVYTHVSTHA